MKNLFYALIALAMATVSCNSDDDDNNNVIIPNPTLTSQITSGSWRVTLYQEEDNVQTDHFTGYNFTFGANNTITASNGVNTYNGNWSLDNDDSSSDDFNIFFSSPDNFAELTEDWDILESTATLLRLKHTSGGDGSVDYLTFTKNP